MSDIEEMDSDKLNELESILYAHVHYNDTSCEKEQPNQQIVVMDASFDTKTKSMPPQRDLIQPHRIVSEKRVINNAKNKPRYWTADSKAESSSSVGAPSSPATAQITINTAEVNTAPDSSSEPSKSMLPPLSTVKTKSTQKNKHSEISSSNTANIHQKQTKPLSGVQKLVQQQQQKKVKPQPRSKKNQYQDLRKPQLPQNILKTAADDEPERFDQRLLVAIPSNCPPVKSESGKRGLGPFDKSSRKLEQLQKLAQKREKSKRAQNSRNLRQAASKEPVELISLVDSEQDETDSDDVIIVPLPPVPIIDVDASDEEQREQQKTVEPYIEENAMDCTDVEIGSATPIVEPVTLPSGLTSPSSSVLSSDDFIVQKDTCRLLADRARATDEDLLVLTETAIRSALETNTQARTDQAEETSSEYEFVPPSRLEQIKQNYRVDEQQFRALDVYESESDLTESGVYCKAKAKPKATPTIVRNLDSESDSSDVEGFIEDNVVKAKRLRKRRASSTNQSQSDPNNLDPEDDDTDDEINAQRTGVPGIARGMAVERVKRKIRRISQRRSLDSAMSPKTSGLQHDGSSESGNEELLPTARQIAERLLHREERKEQEQSRMESEGSDVDTDDAIIEINDVITEDVGHALDRVDVNPKNTKESRSHINAKSTQDVECLMNQEVMENDVVESNIIQKTVVAATVENIEDGIPVVDLESETELENDQPKDNPVGSAIPESGPAIQVEYNLPQLEQKLNGGDLVGWNDEMCRFYNDSWQGEHFNMKKILKGMNSNRSEWKILNADRYPVARKRSNQKCTNCMEMGHMRSKCPRPRKPVVCFTCGEQGHAEPRCPNAFCLGCGSKQSSYVKSCNKCSFLARVVCQLCKMRGHNIELCPDTWRRYHSTTRPNVELNTHVEYRTKNCSNCGARGHLFEECRQRVGEYRSYNCTTRIISYQNVYKDRNIPPNDSCDSKSFFNIETPFHFNWSSEFSKNSCYGRFLKATGLARPLKELPKPIFDSLQPKFYKDNYVPNPQARVASNQTTTSSTTVIVESSGTDQDDHDKNVDSEIQRKPPETQITQNTISNAATGSNKSIIPPHDVDSDSNYSFSDHFAVPSQTSTSTATSNANTKELEGKKAGPMDALPDVIPLNMADGNDDGDGGDININNSVGISMCVNSKATSTTTQCESLPDVPSEAQILMAQDKMQYLFSPEGRLFLTKAAKQCNVNVRIDYKQYGYVLVITGLKKNQEDLQLLLLHHNEDVKRKSIEFQSQKPPKRIDVLIRYIRDGIASLYGDLGNAKHHYHRIKQLEQMNTKNGYKLAERKRRLLNMILFGQAGLENGNMHLDQLLIILERLMDEHSQEDNASTEVRNQIEEHWRIIFTPKPHTNYESLLHSYASLDIKNRLPGLNIDAKLLGLKSPRGGQSAQKRDRIELPPPPPVWRQMPGQRNSQRAVINTRADHQPNPSTVYQNGDISSGGAGTLSVQQNNNKSGWNNVPNRGAKGRSLQRQQTWQSVLEKEKQQDGNNRTRQQRQRLTPYERSTGQQQRPEKLLPCNNMEQRSPISHRLLLNRNQAMQSESAKLLASMERDTRTTINTDSTQPSVFWSRESLKYLDKLFEVTLDPGKLERLQRVLERSRLGQLSYNDYRAVIQLHSMTESS